MFIDQSQTETPVQLCSDISWQDARTCASDHITCTGDDTCVDKRWQCDGESDCKDGSDEFDCPEENCTSWQMRCDNKHCIIAAWKCDGQDDCGDGSDESPEMCAKNTCEEDEFACINPAGYCIPKNLRCDKRKDCIDGSDETGCDMPGCSSEEFRCTNGGCVSKRWVCDGDEDCDDSSDEKGCKPRECAGHELKCANGRCIAGTWRCDRRDDCGDGTDEADCEAFSYSKNVTCKVNEFRCHDASDCVKLAWRCDGEPDCRDQSDEQNCTDVCRHDQFQCTAGECVPGNLECNGIKECADGSDEHEKCNNITVAHRPCNLTTEFDCGKNHCIPLKNVCDGKNNCGEGEDESNLCMKNECDKENGGCQDQCIDQKIGHRCECNRRGFRLGSDQRSCVDIDECVEIPGVCSQYCNNTKGGYKCSCSKEYILEPGTGYCRAQGESPKLLFANRHDVRVVDLISNEYREVISGARSAVAVDYIFQTGTVLWADSTLGQISRAKMFNNISTVIIGRKDLHADNNIEGIAVDWIHNKVYWTDTMRDSISVAELLDGSHAKTLFSSHLQEPRAIVVEPLTGWLFWADWGVSRIEKAGMDGTHRSTLVDTDIEWPNGLAIDRHDNKLYWIDAKLHLISRCDLNGGDRKTVLASRTVFSHPFAIDVFEDWVYWSDWHMERIYRVNKFNGENFTAVSKAAIPMDLVVYHELRQPPGPDRCANHSCAQLCLAAPSISASSSQHSCLCADGYQPSEDGASCGLAATEGPTTTVRTAYESTEKANGKQDEQKVAEDGGRIAGIVIAALSLLALIVATASLLVYRRLNKARHLQSMNFDNPVYRKTTEDQFSLEKPDSPLAEPLTSPGTNDFV
ncbi:vitellogenin receptor-like [Tropilaelaps mercedesae]|uniref:Vitellogenin receptor-like n=1 Tax=Tropilaelaps mercedesae TaxID=418985 RepID=A0A1V9XAX4_9ACAR|nr:vitellogenin receptor-like [Tropilaelaps mercedesae]